MSRTISYPDGITDLRLNLSTLLTLSPSSMMWAAITAMSSRIYMNMVKLARQNAHQQSDNSSSDSLPFPRKGPFPRVIGRPLPATIANPSRNHRHTNSNSISSRSKTPKRAEALMQIPEEPPR
ncbi:3715_t:CDS:2, partial [Acaulospora colombiana]